MQRVDKPEEKKFAILVTKDAGIEHLPKEPNEKAAVLPCRLDEIDCIKKVAAGTFLQLMAPVYAAAEIDLGLTEGIWCFPYRLVAGQLPGL